MRDKLAAAAAAVLEASVDDIVIADGVASVRGAPQSAMPIDRVVQASLPTFAKPGPVSPDFEATVYHHQPTVTYTSAAHVAHVEVDPGTGAVRLLRYLVSHDCGTVINPTIVEGQIQGAVHQGLGYALSETLVLDPETGTLLNGTFMDYRVLTSADSPPIDVLLAEEPEPTGPFGAKGIGEPSIVITAPAVANAVLHALDTAPTALPMTAERVLDALDGLDGLDGA